MSRERSPDRKKAFKIWVESKRTKKPSEIALEMGISGAIVRKWKSVDKWESLPDPRRGPPKGSQNAKGNKGGKGGPAGNEKGLKHGLFRKFLPNDEEMLEIYDAAAELSPLDLLWEGIRIKWSNFIRAQKIQFVRDNKDITKVLVKKKPGMFGTEQEWEYQQPWDKQATAMSSQASAFSSIVRSIKQYDAMLRQLPVDEVKEEQRLRIQKLKLEIDKLANPNDGDADDELVDDWVEGVMENEGEDEEPN